MKELKYCGVFIVLVGLVLLTQVVLKDLPGSENMQLIAGAGLLIIGILMFLGKVPTRIEHDGMVLIIGDLQPPPIPVRKMTKAEKEKILSDTDDLSPAAFNLLEEAFTVKPSPCADPLIPMYMLDTKYRVIDWNDAFALAFDRTLEGRRGENISIWISFLDNSKDVLDHRKKTFSDPDNLPSINVETIEYSSLGYGKLFAKERAYNIPDDDGKCSGWLVTMELEFSDQQKKSKFYIDLLKRLQYAMVWAEYALSYDAVLTNTNIYPELIDTLIGIPDSTDLDMPADNARILDLGAGTGNITKRLAETGSNRLIVALDNNQVMLNILRSKCSKYLRKDSAGPGVIATRQDISELYGFKDNYFDNVFLNNVLYSLDESQISRCLAEVYRVLKPGGEVRICGPKETANLDVLYKKIRRELKDNGELDMLRGQCAHVMEVNKKYLQPMLHKWDAADIYRQLKKAGFDKAYYTNEKIYAGQSRIVCSRKNIGVRSNIPTVIGDQRKKGVVS